MSGSSNRPSITRAALFCRRLVGTSGFRYDILGLGKSADSDEVLSQISSRSTLKRLCHR
jgi:hypothetical protein